MEVDVHCKAAPAGIVADDRAARRKSAIGFGLAVSAACAAAGGALLAYLPGVSMGAAFGLGFGGLLFLQSFSFFFVPMLRPVEDMPKARFLRMTEITFVLAMLLWASLIAALLDKATATTAIMLVSDVAGAVWIGWFLFDKDGAPAQGSF